MAEVVTYSRLQHVSVLTEFIETQIYSVHLLFGNKYIHTHTHTHNHFTALLDFVWDYPHELAPER